MFKSFSIKNFRCFNALDINQLGRVNLISGKNNVGKSALLEAIYLHLGGGNPLLSINVNKFRGLEPFISDVENTWGWLFSNLSIDKPIIINSIDDTEVNHLLKIALQNLNKITVSASEKSSSSSEESLVSDTISNSFQLEFCYKKNKEKEKKRISRINNGQLEVDNLPSSVFPTSYFVGTRNRSLREDASLFSKLEEIKKDNEVLRVMQEMEPRLKRLAVAVVNNVPTIRGDFGGERLIPLSLVGEGMCRLLSIITRILLAKDAVVLIDEIENGIHHSILERFWEVIAEAAIRSNCQIIATTHSRECVLAAHTIFSENKKYDFAYHRLDRTKDDINVISYDKETLDAAFSAYFEIR